MAVVVIVYSELPALHKGLPISFHEYDGIAQFWGNWLVTFKKENYYYCFYY
jgi:hypothetical protein